MAKPDDLSRSLVPFEQSSTLVAVIEMSLSSWLVAGIVPGLDRHPLKKLGADEDALLRLLQRWRDKAVTAGVRSPALRSPLRPAVMAFGSRAGSGHTTSRLT